MVSIYDINFWHYGDALTFEYIPFLIYPYRSESFDPLNGKWPVNKTYSKTPKAHTSTGLPK